MGKPYVRISIHALREEGDTFRQSLAYLIPISIHALREEGDRVAFCGFERIEPFLSTPSARRATNYLNKSTRPLEISIHALREEGD